MKAQTLKNKSDKNVYKVLGMFAMSVHTVQNLIFTISSRVLV